jgi:cytochrome c553
MIWGTPLLPALLALAVLMLPGQASAEANLDAGRAVVVGGKEATVTPCFLCHGLDGAGDSAGAFPRLTGQAAFYMYKQLVDYASGQRPDDIMSPIAREMTEQQMEEVSFYYSVIDAPYLSRPELDPAMPDRARAIAEDGLPERDVQACNLCHGRDGRGNPPLFPYLAGQYALYTELQLRLFRQNTRDNDPLGVMRQIAEGLSDEDIRALALYYEWLRPDEGGAERGTEVGARERGRSGG